ncbi:MAG: DUF3429 domain-containing protein [Gammaproteobacteria bacterium]|nr:DUF3429 domain-containing protein [Gammaproteobacteria bacterium]
MSLQSRSAMPLTVAWLGYGGLVPFVALALGSLIDDEQAAFFSAALRAYGAVILSFVGALHWGFAMTLSEFRDESAQRRQNETFGWSVVPALLAWPALLVPGPLASGLLIAGFAAHYGQDRRLAAFASLPAWYLPMRLRLSACACLCLATGVLTRLWCW